MTWQDWLPPILIFLAPFVLFALGNDRDGDFGSY